MHCLGSVDGILLQCSLLMIVSQNVCRWWLFFINILDQHIQQTSVDSLTSDESHWRIS